MRFVRVFSVPIPLLSLLLLAACNMLPPEQQATSAVTEVPTIEVTPVLPADTPSADGATVVAGTPNGTPAGEDTALAAVASETPAFTPSEPTPACSGAPVQRLIVQERGMVTENGLDLNVRPEAGIGDENEPLGKLNPGDIFLVLEGPICANRYAWFRVRSNRFEGWIAEGDTAEYYTIPYLPG